jgi:hypothetical protein
MGGRGGAERHGKYSESCSRRRGLAWLDLCDAAGRKSHKPRVHHWFWEVSNPL